MTDASQGGAQAPPVMAYDLCGRALDGRYRVLQRLGAGGMGSVYLGEHVALGNRVAIKVLQANLAANEKFRRRFLREARAASAIRNDHVVQITDFGHTSDGIVYFVMEFLEGLDLEKLLRKDGPMPWARARGIFGQVLSALRAAHTKKIVHRDIKPANCLIYDDPERDTVDNVKVLDFGLAKVSVDDDGASHGLTGTSELFGTVAYMAPELTLSKPADVRSDLYALGILMYRTLVGALPFRAPNAYLVLNKHVNEPPPPPRSRNASIPEAVEALILRALAKEPEHRFQSAREMLEALAAIPAEAVGGPYQVPVGDAPASGGDPQTGAPPSQDNARPLAKPIVAAISAAGPGSGQPHTLVVDPGASGAPGLAPRRSGGGSTTLLGASESEASVERRVASRATQPSPAAVQPSADAQLHTQLAPSLESAPQGSADVRRGAQPVATTSSESVRADASPSTGSQDSAPVSGVPSGPLDSAASGQQSNPLAPTGPHEVVSTTGTRSPTQIAPGSHEATASTARGATQMLDSSSGDAAATAIGGGLHAPVAASASTSTTQGEPEPRARGPLLWAGAAAVVLAFGSVVGLGLFGDDEPREATPAVAGASSPVVVTPSAASPARGGVPTVVEQVQDIEGHELEVEPAAGAADLGAGSFEPAASGEPSAASGEPPAASGERGSGAPSPEPTSRPEPASVPQKSRRSPSPSPLTDDRVKSRIIRKAKSRCKGGGTVKVSAFVQSTGQPSSASSFSGGTSEGRECVKKVVMSQKFPAKAGRMITFSVGL